MFYLVAQLPALVQLGSIEPAGPRTFGMLAAGCAISLLLVLLSSRLGYLSRGGAATAFFMGWTVIGFGGIECAVPLLTFFFSSSFLSKVGRARKKRFDLIFEKGSRRDMGQVLGNGGVTWLMSFVYYLAARPESYAALVGALAAAQADTWATEVGTMAAGANPRSILGFRPVPPGTSGGVTWQGTLGGLAGILLICASAWLAAPGKFGSVPAWRWTFIIAFAGVLGSLTDSVLGATIQGKYFDPVRNVTTERAFRNGHSGPEPNPIVEGFRWVTNDVVNFLCTLTGATTAFLLL